MAAAPLLADARDALTEDVLTPEQRMLIVDQATLVVTGLFAHLPQKRALYGIDPAGRLRRLQRSAATVSDAEFHAELGGIIDDLQDLHTSYELPLPYDGVASLGFLLERCWADGRPRWTVSHVNRGLVGRSRLVPGAEVLRWNGMPIEVAVARNADREAGSNPDARLARGAEALTQRVLFLSPLPDEDWVDVGFTVDGTAHETRVHWRIVAGRDVLDPVVDDEGPVAVGPRRQRAVDRRTEVVQRVKKELFAAPDAAAAAEDVPTELAGVRARIVTTAHGRFGHLRIYTFGAADEQWVLGMAALLEELPHAGLVLDVRGNGGGYIYGAEALLQLFTPGRIRPAPFQVVATDLAAALCRDTPDFAGWSAAVDEALATGAQFSRGIPIIPEPWVNDLGQRYHGPVVLVTDALCYSATDMFAAGFQDHGIGPVLGVDGNTGAGGANVVSTVELLSTWPRSPLEPLPNAAALQLSIRRSLRVGDRAGQPLEDLGVVPDERHLLTRRDLLERNADLLDRAAELLTAGTPRRLDARLGARTGGSRVTLTVEGVTSVDVYADGRPVAFGPVPPGRSTLDIPDAAGRTVRVEGFTEEDGLVAARVLGP